MWTFSVFLLFTPYAFASEAPVLLLSEDTAIEEIVSQSASHASADIKGKGGSITLKYSTLEPLSLFVMFKGRDGSFNTFDTLKTVLPEGSLQEATIDLTKSPAWQPVEQSYRLYFFSNSKTGAQFHDSTFNPASLFTIFSAAIHQTLILQPYSPASYHRLPGYRVLGIPLTVVLGLGMILIVVFLILTRKKQMIIPVSIIIVLITQARFSIDVLRLSIDHSTEWLLHKTYSTAGSLPEIAQNLIEEKARSAYLCHTGTTYASKLLQYHAYPVIISDDKPDYIIIYKSTNWSIDGKELRCNEKQFSVNFIKKYNDGSALYQNNI